METVKKSFFIEIKLSDEQIVKVNKTMGVCRYVYNLFIEKNKELYSESGKFERSKFMSGYEFSKWLNNVYTKENDVWIKDVSSKAVKQAIMNGDTAFKKYFKGLSGYPKFKKKKDQDVKCYFPKNNKTDWTIERHRVKVPTIGWVRFKEYGYVPKDAIVKSGTISRKAGRYYISILCEIKKEKSLSGVLTKDGLGIDLGMKNFAVVSNGSVVKNVNKTEKVRKLERKLSREQRSLLRKYKIMKKMNKSNTSKKSNYNKNVYRVQKLYARLSNIRLEHVKSAVISVVKTKPQFITIEDLNIKGMMKNRHLSDEVANQCFYEFKFWLTAKCREYGIELRQVDRYYPSSKMCSCCGSVKSDLKLSDRVYSCSCGNEMNRDLNAAINLMKAKEYTILT